MLQIQTGRGITTRTPELFESQLIVMSVQQLLLVTSAGLKTSSLVQVQSLTLQSAKHASSRKGQVQVPTSRTSALKESSSQAVVRRLV